MTKKNVKDAALADPNGLEAKVNAIIDQRLHRWRQLVYAFVLGFSCLVLALVVNGLVAREALIIMLHNQMFSLRKSLNAILGRQVAYSYSDQFWLPRDGLRSRNITFYLRKGQTANVYFSVKHSGTGETSTVTLAVAGAKDPVWRSRQDTTHFESHALERFISKERPDEATIQVVTVSAEADSASKDIVFVQLVITVIGLEEQ